jgi:hypothetical protein
MPVPPETVTRRRRCSPRSPGSGAFSAECRGELATTNAAGLALGVFLSFSPFLGLQILLGIGLAGIFASAAGSSHRALHEPAVDHGALVCRHHRDGGNRSRGIDYRGSRRASRIFRAAHLPSAFWSRAAEVIGAVLWPFLIGSSAGALVLATAAYAIALRVWDGANPRRYPGLRATQSRNRRSACP